MKFYLLLPIAFLQFWFVEAPSGLLAFFVSLNSSFFQLFSLPLFLHTFFKPIKNEYRKGLVGFSIGMGIFIKSFFIIADVLIFLVLLAGEFLILSSFILFPFALVFLLFV